MMLEQLYVHTKQTNKQTYKQTKPKAKNPDTDLTSFTEINSKYHSPKYKSQYYKTSRSKKGENLLLEFGQ